MLVCPRGHVVEGGVVSFSPASGASSPWFIWLNEPTTNWRLIYFSSASDARILNTLSRFMTLTI